MTTTAQHIAASYADPSNTYYHEQDTPEERVEAIREACLKATKLLQEKFPALSPKCELNDWGKFSNFDVHVTPNWERLIKEWDWADDNNLPKGMTNSVKAIMKQVFTETKGVNEVKLVDAPYKKKYSIHGDLVSKYVFMCWTFDIDY